MTTKETNSSDTDPLYTKKELRQFAFIMAAMILFLFTVFFPWLYGMAISTIPFVISALFAGTALIAPKLLSPIYSIWMKFSHILGFINSKILLFIIFYLLLVPMGLIAKIFGFNPMNKKGKSGSYYIQREQDNNNMEDPF